MGGAAHVLHTLTAEHLLELRLAPPGDELPAVVREDLPRCSPLADGSPHHFQDRLGRLLPEEAVTHDIPRVIVDNPHQVDPEHPLELEGEDVDLPQGIRYLPLEAPYLGISGFGGRGRVAKIGVVDDTTDRFGGYFEPLVAPQLVADAPHSHLGVGTTELLDPPFQSFAKLAGARVRRLPYQRLRPLIPVKLKPLTHGIGTRPHQLRHFCWGHSGLSGSGGQQLHLHRKPLPARGPLPPCHRGYGLLLPLPKTHPVPPSTGQRRLLREEHVNLSQTTKGDITFWTVQ